MATETAKKEDWTIGEMLQWGQGYFLEKGIDSPRLTIELLLTHVTGLERIGLYTSFDKPLSKPEKQQLRSLIQRRLKHEPLQYILGKAPFWGMYIHVAPCVLIPRPETEILVDEIISYCKINSLTNPSILDIGTGSGCIALALAKELPNASITAVDTSTEALTLAQTNQFAERITWLHANILQENISSSFDIIVSNPPYIGTEDMNDIAPELIAEPEIALTDYADGLTFYRHFASTFPNMLSPQGIFFVECAYNQARDIVTIFQNNGFTCSVTKDLSGIERIISGKKSS